jgi:hypothetical protein
MATRLMTEDELEFNADSLFPFGESTQSLVPQAVLFGDSMSEYVGYNPDGTPDTKYGSSVADVIANNLGIQVQNLATGGETSNEALAGGAKFGAFQSYIEQNRPQYAIIRYGAADAIKNQDPAITLQSVQQMVDIARANGVTPIIVGVSELYGAQNSKTGNIAGYIDPAAEQRANQINDGLRQLAESNGLSFTDVRQATSAGTGDLLDGVHTNADFGKKMADAISEDIAAKNVIAEARVPQLPPNVDSLSNEEKGRLYNDFISQGYTDAQIRTAARAESDQDWNALKRIAADVRNTTPAAIEQQATMQTPQGAAIISEPMPQANRLDLQSLVTPEDAANIRSAYEIGAAYPIVRGNEVYSFNPDGSIEYTRMNPGGIGATLGLYSATGEEIVPQYYNADFGKTSNATRLLQAGLAAGIGGILGPAGAGLLSAPVAAATGAGLTSYGVTGDLESALKSAALGGLTAFGIETLFPTAAQTAANTAVDLAGAGASQANIVNALVEQGVGAVTASQIAGDALAGATARQIATDFAGISVGGAGAASSGLPNMVTITGGANPASLLATAAPSAAGAISGGLLGSAAQSTSPNLLSDTQSVTVQGATTPAQVQATAPAAAIGAGLTPSQTVQVQTTTAPAQSDVTAPAAVVGAITPSQAVQAQAPAQQVQVQTTTAAQDITADIASAVLSSLVGQPVSVAGATQQVQVTGQAPVQQVAPEVAAALISAATGQQVTVAGQTISPQTTPETVGAATGGLLSDTMQTVPVQSTTLPAETQISAPAGAAVGGLLSNIVQTVPVTGQTMATTPAVPETVGSVIGSLVPTQTVPVTGQTIATQPEVPTTVGAAIGSIVPTQTVPVTSSPLAPTPEAPSVIGSVIGSLVPSQSVAVTGTTEQTPVVPREVVGSLIPTVVPPPAQQVTVQSKPIVEDEFTPILTPPPVLPPKFEVPIPEVKVAEPTKPLVSTNDLLKLLTLLGTGTAGTGMMGGGTNIGSIPPSDTMLGSTTPQFGPDYYAAIQRYYNAYMPAYPRNVAGPLQQWYENKYGA